MTAGDIELPSGSVLITDPETLVLAVLEAPTAEELEAEVAEAAEELGVVEQAPAAETAAPEEEHAEAAPAEASAE